MSGSQLIPLKWQYLPADEEDRDLRTFNVFVDMGQVQSLQLYKFRTIQGVLETVTTFEKFNTNRPALRWEIAGEIHWMRNYTGYVIFGLERFQFHEIRRRKKATSRSRRFLVGELAFKWKIADNGNDLVCVDSNKFVVCAWSASTQTLRFVRDAQPLLDRLVVTCLVNQWFKEKGRW